MKTYKTIEEARAEAKSTTNPAYEISIEKAESVKSLVGKTLTKEGRPETMEILEWIGQNYVVKGSGVYMIVPAIYALQMSQSMIVK